MTFFTSEYKCKLDIKGRLILPARIKAQLPVDGQESRELVIRTGFEPCLIIYPINEFKRVLSRISGLNEFSGEERQLQRTFMRGVTTVEMDQNGRFLIPKNYLTYASLKKDIILVGTGRKIEIWNPSEYEKNIITDLNEFSELAKKHLNEK